MSATPGLTDFWFLPLGGCGEIGMNLNLYGHDGQWLMVDLGVTFNREGQEGPEIQMPDPEFIAHRRGSLSGLVITHAHEDHVGAVAHLWPELKCPVYTTRFTGEVLRRKLTETGLAGKVPINIVAPGDTRKIGPFTVGWVPMTHSIPDCHGLSIETPAARVFHTADWKLDARPVLGRPFESANYQRLGDSGIDAVICDSTNANRVGGPVFEADLYAPLKAAVEDASGRVVVTCFGSNLARLHTIARVAAATGRYIGLLGRSLFNMVNCARAADLWHPETSLSGPRELGFLPRHEVLAIATGSQGEPRTALARLAQHNHYDMELEAGDTVIFSSRVIPGNEQAVAKLERALARIGVHIIRDEDLAHPIHASGHPTAEELRDMYGWLQPRLAIPVHGEATHMQANAEVARAAGVRQTLVGENGDLFRIAPYVAHEPDWAPNGRLGIEGGRLLPCPVPWRMP